MNKYQLSEEYPNITEYNVARLRQFTDEDTINKLNNECKSIKTDKYQYVNAFIDLSKKYDITDTFKILAFCDDGHEPHVECDTTDYITEKYGKDIAEKLIVALDKYELTQYVYSGHILNLLNADKQTLDNIIEKTSKQTTSDERIFIADFIDALRKNKLKDFINELFEDRGYKEINQDIDLDSGIKLEDDKESYEIDDDYDLADIF